MANQEQLDLLKRGVKVWNQWREEEPSVRPDLRGAKLRDAHFGDANFFKANLRGADLRGANFFKADLRGAYLHDADLREARLIAAIFRNANLQNANLQNANLRDADLFKANLFKANLCDADLRGAYLTRVNLAEANLTGANLIRSTLVETNLTKATLTRCSIYGIAVWDVELKEAIQKDLVITPLGEPTITVDNLKVAQFIYLLLNNREIRDVIDTITSKVVLILGRFTPERKSILDAIKEELSRRNYAPVLFDFDKPSSRDWTETVSTLAHLARFIIVDLTDPSSAPHEVATIAPHCIVPVQPLLSLQPLIIEEKTVERREYAMFQDLRRRYDWVLPTFRYQDSSDLLASLQEYIIDPAEQKAKELEKR